MRYGIFSDVHSNLEALKTVLDAYKKESIDKYLCVGDVVGYASNPQECIEIVRLLAMATVAGNHDWASVGKFPLEYFNLIARQAVDWTKDNLGQDARYFLESLKPVYKNEDLTLVHGTLDNPQDFNYLIDAYLAEETFKLQETDVCFVGHTHLPAIFIKDRDGAIHYLEDAFLSMKPGNKYIVNVGSVGQPRDGDPRASYAVYDTDKKEIRINRIDYDIEAARKKIIEAGLPKLLGDRLLSGR